MIAQRPFWSGFCVVVLSACSGAERGRSPVIVPTGGHIAAIVDRWQPQCPTPAPPFPVAWDSTLGDTALIFAAPLNGDTIASLFEVRRALDGRLWHTYDGGAYSPDVATESLAVGPWQVYAGAFEQQIYPSDIDVPMENGRALTEHWRQSWFFGFAADGPECAVVVAWRSLPVGSYRGPRYSEREVQSDSVVAYFRRIQWRGAAPPNKR